MYPADHVRSFGGGERNVQVSRRVYRHDDLLGMRMVENVAARVQHETSSYLIEANADGFRCRHDFAADPSSGRRRILLFGDSFTVGTGVRADRRFGDLLESALDDVEVYNFGLTGSGTDQQYLAYDHIGRHLHHDLIVVVPWVENIRRNPAHHRVWSDSWADRSADDESVVLQAKPYFELGPDGALELRNVPVPKPVPYDSVGEGELQTGSRAQRFGWARELVKTKAPWAKDLLQRLSRVQPVPEYDDPNDPNWVLMRAILLRWHAEATAPMLVCPIPMYQHIEGHASPDGYQARFNELARPSNGLMVHDALSVLQRGDAKTRRAMRFGHDIHFTDSGHAAFAEALTPAVRAALAGLPDSPQPAVGAESPSGLEGDSPSTD